MPGVLQLEALAQMLTVAITTLPGNKGKVCYVSSYKIKFKKEVKPGRKFIIKTKIKSLSRGICHGVGFGFTDGEIACEAEMIITIPEILKKFLPKK
jgi:3-hydroxyacyl-[acyl-carrier-protein] dehydratase